jgi:hypothetical protein
MGGFKPSRADIAGSTTVGSDKDVDVHAFTGSVNITGSLTLNGSAITGGGGGGTPGGADTQVQFNDAGAFGGSANLTFDGSNLTTTGSLYISSSAAGNNIPLLRIDHAGALDDNPILFVTGSGFVGIGVLEPTYLLQIAASYTGGEPGGTNQAFKVQDDGGSEWFSINGGTISFNSGGGVTNAGGISLGQRFNIAPINASVGALGIGKFAGSTANIVEVNSANSDEGGDFFVIDSDGNVGIGEPNPSSHLHLSSSADTVMIIEGSGDVGIRLAADTDGGPGENDNPYIDFYQDGQSPVSRNNRLASLAMEGDAGTTFTGSLANTVFLDAFCPGATPGARTLQLATDNGTDHSARLTVATDGNIGIGTTSPTELLDVAGTANVTTLSIGGISVTSTAAELNLLDASDVAAPSEGLWTGIERVAVMNIGAAEYAIGSHVLGVTLPDQAIITRAVLDVGTAFNTGGPAALIGLTTTGNTYPLPGQPAEPIDFLSMFGVSPAVFFAVLSAETAIAPLTIVGGKLNGASTVTFQVVDFPLIAGDANLYVYYIMGS